MAFADLWQTIQAASGGGAGGSVTQAQLQEAIDALLLEFGGVSIALSGLSQTITSAQHNKTQIRGYLVTNPEGEEVSVVFTIQGTTVTIDSTIDLTGHNLLVY